MRPVSCARLGLGLAVLVLVPSLSFGQLSGVVPPKGQTLTTPILKRMLEDMGYEPEETTKDIFRIQIERDNWKIPVRLYILKEAHVIWMDATLSQIENPELVPPQALVRLLKENEKIGPAHFALHSTDKFLHMYEPIENREISQAILRKRIDGFDGTVRKTFDVWKAENFKSTGASIPPKDPIPPVVNALAKEKERLRGTWMVTKIVSGGNTIEGEALSDQEMTMSFDLNGSLTIRRKGAPDDAAKWVIDIEPSPRSIDITNKEGRLEKSIYKFDGDTLTICFANPGIDRPSQFGAPEGFQGGMLVMKKQP